MEYLSRPTIHRRLRDCSRENYYYGKWSNADEELKEIDKDRDYWKAEALKHCLGEIKLLVGRI